MDRALPAFAVVFVASLGCTSTHGYTAGDSMLPTIAVGARVATTALEGDPRRGDVVVFHAPDAPDREYVKRILGLPGDTLSTNDGAVVVNGAPVPRCRVGGWRYVDADGKAHEGDVWLEAIEGASWLVFRDAHAPAMPSGPWTVAPGEVFVLGDNRDNSHDSRVWFGGKGGGLPFRFIVGVTPAASSPTLPDDARSLEPALRACVAKLSG